MGDDARSGRMASGSRRLLLSVEPALLAGALSRVLAAAGWEVATEVGGDDRVVAAVASQDRVVELGDVRSELTVVLPDEAGRGGSVRRAGAATADVLPGGGDQLQRLLEVLAHPVG